jgi:hypothetical protein
LPSHRVVDRWRPTAALDEAELERLADRLLRESARARPATEYPFHSERRLFRDGDSREDMALRPPELAAPDTPGQVDGRWLTEIMAEAGLTRTERRCLRLLATGLCAAEIADRTGLSREHVSRCLRSAWRHLEPVLTGDGAFQPRAAWSARAFHDVYWSEVMRPIYRAPECCRPGKERCKRLGYCPVRYMR